MAANARRDVGARLGEGVAAAGEQLAVGERAAAAGKRAGDDKCGRKEVCGWQECSSRDSSSAAACSVAISFRKLSARLAGPREAARSADCGRAPARRRSLPSPPKQRGRSSRTQRAALRVRAGIWRGP